jgi:hypothetical protein
MIYGTEEGATWKAQGRVRVTGMRTRGTVFWGVCEERSTSSCPAVEAAVAAFVGVPTGDE